MNHNKTTMKYGMLLLALTALLGLSGCGGQANRTAAGAQEQPTQTQEQTTAAIPAQPEPAAASTPVSVLVYSDSIQSAESACPYDGGVLFSNFGGEDGGYVLYRRNGVTETLIPAGAGLNRPTGMAAANGRIYVCDGDSVKVFDAANVGAGYTEIRLGEDGHLFNDVELVGNDLYISVTDADAIYRVDVSADGAVPEKWVEVSGPNGIVVGGGSMYIASISKDFTSVNADNVIYRVSDLGAPQAEPFVEVPGLYDGVALSDDGSTLYYSDWNTASVEAVEIGAGRRATLYKEAGIGPADIVQKGGILYVPDLTGNRILELAVASIASMSAQEMQDRMEIRELTDRFANLADTKEVDKQVELFLPDGTLEFQMGFDGEINEIEGREALEQAFGGTVGPAKNVYHLNGQQTLTAYSGDKAEGVAYCQATLVNEVDGADVTTTNYVRYTDHYAKVDGKWYIETRRTTFLFTESR